MNSLILSHVVVMRCCLMANTIENHKSETKNIWAKYAFLLQGLSLQHYDNWKLTDIICYTADGEVTNFPPSPPQYINRGIALMDKGKHHCYEWPLQLKNIRNEGALEVTTLLPL